MIVYSNNDIKELDETIVHIEILKSKAKKIENIWHIKDAEVDKPTPNVICQANHENKNLDEDLEKLKQQAKDKDDQWAQQ